LIAAAGRIHAAGRTDDHADVTLEPEPLAETGQPKPIGAKGTDRPLPLDRQVTGSSSAVEMNASLLGVELVTMVREQIDAI
jgi:hypothetical protein